MPITFSGRFVAAAISVMGNEDVFVAKIVCSGVISSSSCEN